MGEETIVNSVNKINSGVDPTGNESEDVLLNGLNGDGANHTNQDIALHRVKQKLETFQVDIVSEVQKKMERMVENIIQEMRLYELNASQFKDFARQQSNHIWSNRVSTKIDGESRKRKLPDKVFIPRQSYLTSLLEINHMKGIYHIFFVIFSVIFLNLFIHDLVVHGRLNFGFGTIQTGFGRFHLAMGLWACMQVAAFGLYFAFKLWATVSCSLKKSEASQRLWNYACVSAFVTFQVLFLHVVPTLCVRLDLPVISTTVVVAEMTRFIMKMHAFVRTNAPLAVRVKAKVEDDASSKGSLRVPPFSAYLYFLFAPTLIYRDSYPRTKHINWRFAAKNLTEVVAVMFFISFIFERHLRPYFGNFGKEKITLGYLTVAVCGMVAPALLIFLALFYCILHAWQNFAAELLRFADRMFYKDWWTATNFENYFRDWNIVVHDWLYEYIYKDFYIYVFRGSKVAAGMSVFLISAIIHEYLIAYTFRFMYPVMFCIFTTVGLVLVRLFGKSRAPVGNFILWWLIGVGNGIMMSLYSAEYYARQNCPVGDSWKDYFVPVSWYCNGYTS